MMLELRFVAPDLRRLDESSAEVVACGIWRDARPLTGLAGVLDWRLSGRLSRLLREGFVLGEVGEVLVVPVRPRLPFDKLLALGLGPRPTFDETTFRTVLERALDAIRGLHVKKALLELPGRGDEAISTELATAIFLEVLGEEGDVVSLIEEPGAQKEIERHAAARRRGPLRTH
jgi:hypothetical protein